jgi:hypothetical protein
MIWQAKHIIANFIEWQQLNRPDLAYFSNHFGIYRIPEENIPLDSPDNRVIALQWGQYVLEPGGTFLFKIAVGMADNNPQTGFPVKPITGLN